MAISQLGNLPIETLLRICQHLAPDDLRALALTSKPCNVAAIAQLFHTITITINAESMRDRSSAFQQLFARLSCANHVRRLTVVDEPEYEDEYPWADEGGQEEGEGDGQENPPRPDERSAAFWDPLGELLQSLPALSDLVWASLRPFPPVLLAVLHRQLPSCRLHLQKFTFSQGKVEENATEELLTLLSSPNLHSIWFRWTLRDSNGKDNHTFEAVTRIIQGVAPNLREVKSQWYRGNSGGRFGTGPRKPFQDFVPEDRFPKTCGALERLELMGSFHSALPDLQAWCEITDFEKLQSLRVHMGIDRVNITFLARDCQLTSLKSIHMYIPSKDISDLVVEFLGNLPALESLSLDGELDRRSLETVLERRGPSLRVLQLEPEGMSETRLVMSNDDLAMIAAQCPVLEELAVYVRRTKGDEREVAGYKILGSIPRLHRLKLHLDTSTIELLRKQDPTNPEEETPDDPSFSESDRQLFNTETTSETHHQPRNGHVRDTFINSALDEALARSIFAVIDKSRAQSNSPQRRALEELVLVPTGGGNFGDGSWLVSINNVIKEISRHWHLQRNVRDDKRDEIVVKLHESWEVPLSDEYWEPGLYERVETIYHNLWPAKEQEAVERWKGSWRGEWFSFPLATD